MNGSETASAIYTIIIIWNLTYNLQIIVISSCCHYESHSNTIKNTNEMNSSYKNIKKTKNRKWNREYHKHLLLTSIVP